MENDSKRGISKVIMEREEEKQKLAGKERKANREIE